MVHKTYKIGVSMIYKHDKWTMIDKDVELMIPPNDLANLVRINTFWYLTRKSFFIFCKYDGLCK